MIGRILALQTVLLVGTAPIGGPISGVIADAFGARAPVVVGGVAAIVAGIWGFATTRRVNRPRAGTLTVRGKRKWPH